MLFMLSNCIHVFLCENVNTLDEFVHIAIPFRKLWGAEKLKIVTCFHLLNVMINLVTIQVRSSHFSKALPFAFPESSFGLQNQYLAVLKHKKRVHDELEMVIASINWAFTITWC